MVKTMKLISQTPAVASLSNLALFATLGIRFVNRYEVPAVRILRVLIRTLMTLRMEVHFCYRIKVEEWLNASLYMLATRTRLINSKVLYFVKVLGVLV